MYGVVGVDEQEDLRIHRGVEVSEHNLLEGLLKCRDLLLRGVTALAELAGEDPRHAAHVGREHPLRFIAHAQKEVASGKRAIKSLHRSGKRAPQALLCGRKQVSGGCVPVKDQSACRRIGDAEIGATSAA